MEFMVIFFPDVLMWVQVNGCCSLNVCAWQLSSLNPCSVYTFSNRNYPRSVGLTAQGYTFYATTRMMLSDTESMQLAHYCQLKLAIALWLNVWLHITVHLSTFNWRCSVLVLRPSACMYGFYWATALHLTSMTPSITIPVWKALLGGSVEGNLQINRRCPCAFGWVFAKRTCATTDLQQLSMCALLGKYYLCMGIAAM